MVELTFDSHYARLGVPPDAPISDIRAARDMIIKGLRERRRREPANSEALLAEESQINAEADEIVRPARRAEYDSGHPHLAFLSVRRAAAPMFHHPPDRMDAAYRAVRRHLDAAGIDLPPQSDLDRHDFTDDFTPMPLLDD